MPLSLRKTRQFFLLLRAGFWGFLFVSPLFGEEGLFRFHKEENDSITLLEGKSPLWKYNAKFAIIPGVPREDPRCMAACYLHPVYGINGEILTDNAPRDHYHHHGVFWNWPHVNVHRPDGTVEKYDTWTGNTRMKQLFVRYKNMQTLPDKAVLELENGWFIAPEINHFEWDNQGRPLSEKVVVENLRVTTHAGQSVDGLRTRSINLDFEWQIGDFPISLQGAGGKSYGGLTMRFRPSTDKPGAESTITVPSGIAETDLPDTPLPWADYTSLFHRDEQGKPVPPRSGAALFVSPDHPDYPPSWLTRYYGPLCIGWPGVEEKSFAAGEKIRLSYKIWIHSGPVTAEQLERAYK